MTIGSYYPLLYASFCLNAGLALGLGFVSFWLFCDLWSVPDNTISLLTLFAATFLFIGAGFASLDAYGVINIAPADLMPFTDIATQTSVTSGLVAGIIMLLAGYILHPRKKVAIKTPG